MVQSAIWVIKFRYSLTQMQIKNDIIVSSTFIL